jgi:LacI family transcriptional regulator
MRVALYVNLAAGDARALYRALLDELAERHPEWELADTNWRRLAHPLRDGIAFDAYLGSPLAGDELRQLAALGIPAVGIGNPVPGTESTAIGIDYDNEAFGRQAAAVLRERGWRSFAFCGDDDVADSRGRLAGFRAELGAAAPEPAVWSRADGGSLAELGDWLEALPVGTAILARSDPVALRVATAARERGLAIPGRLGLLGIDDEDLARTLARLDLASLRRDEPRIAALALDLLECQLAGEPLTPGIRRIGPHPHPYLGTSINPPEQISPLVRRAVQAMRELPVADLTPEVLAQAAGCSRRTLERAFAAEWSESLAEAVRRVRMEHARRWCAGGDLSLAQIARALGFNHAGNFTAAYRRFWGVAPRGRPRHR